MLQRMRRFVGRFVFELAFFALTFLACAALFAQDTLPLPAPADQTQALVVAIFAAALPFAVAAVKTLIPGMPRILIWGLGPLLGTAIAWITNLGGLTSWKGLAAGLVAIALNELKTTLQQHGLNG